MCCASPESGRSRRGCVTPPRGRTRDERTEPGAGEGREGGNGDGPTGRRRQVAGGARSRRGSTEKGSTEGGSTRGVDGRLAARTDPGEWPAGPGGGGARRRPILPRPHEAISA